ncbi:hypothetical protein BH09MYX1_BH09MYX1_53140 [soil metagenome]
MSLMKTRDAAVCLITILASPLAAAHADEPSVPSAPPAFVSNVDRGDAPIGYHAESRPNRGLIIGGSVVFGVAYAAALAGAFLSSFSKESFLTLVIPLVGPYVAAAQASDATSKAVFVGDGIVQAGGVVMFVAGFLAPRTVYVKDDFSIRPAPIAAANGWGIGASGTF